MPAKIMILGYGPIGRAVARQLSDAGREALVAQRREPANLPSGARFRACDALDRASLTAALQGHDVLICTIGLAYDAAIWERDWPRLMTNMLAACEANGARLVFVDDLYMHGPQRGPLHENTPLDAPGRKGRVRAAITRQWQAMSAVKTAALRVADFYGPGVVLSVLGQEAIGRLAAGRAAQLGIAADEPHAFAYAPDVATAAILLADAADDAYGRAWIMPCAPARTPRAVIGMAAAALGVKPRLQALPGWLQKVMGRFVPFLGEWTETSYQHDRPFLVDGSSFERYFGFRPMPLEQGISATAASFRKS
ncbi:NAD-dependent epimerase/dehydratase family protein [Labrys portucalensis]|uniref:NAD-dependent epimerase/dehydratase family protein n=1 Tax=Labrys neptuniae TaxID=376174 RepID=A0ABV6ZBR9_9HYPH